jgi:ABC-type transport system substrate-binding protein
MWNKFKLGLIGVLFLTTAIPSAIAASPADPSKVLHAVFEADGDGFDPVRSINYYSGYIIEAIFEPLLGYDYLARPVKLVPKTVDAMPEISDGGKTYTFHLKKGIRFSPDPAFKGKPRELTAADYVYSFKRVLDPRNRSQISSFLEGKIAGLDALVEQARESGHFDYDAPIEGLQAVDRYTLRIRLTKPDYNFQYVVAYQGLGAVAREVVEANGGEIRPHPVGTGPYMLEQYVPNSKIVLTANPEYRGFVWDFAAAESGDEQLVSDMRGKKMPQIGRVEVSIIEEEQARWLAFHDQQLDLDFLPQVAAPKVMNGDRLKPEFEQRGIHLSRLVQAGVVYTIFNFRDPVVGGYSKEKIALRRAIAMSYNTDDEISLIRNGQAIKAQMIMPPSVAGYDPDYRSSIRYDPELANKLLDKFGYRRGADGYRTTPDGKPLTVRIYRESALVYQEMAELWKRGLDKIGIRSEHPVGNFADNQKLAIECKLMMWSSGWNADFPDGENFLQLLYGPNAGKGNHSCYQSPAFDAMYAKATTLPPGTERNRLYAKMNRQVEVDGAWMVGVWRIRNYVAQPWVKGFKKHPILHAEWPYLDVGRH